MRRMLASILLAVFIIGLPVSAQAQEPEPPLAKAWNNEYGCSGGYVDMPVTVMNRSSRASTFSVTFLPGHWESRIVAVPAGGKRTVAIRITANGVHSIVVIDVDTGKRVEWPTDKPVNCVSMQGNPLPKPPVAPVKTLNVMEDRESPAAIDAAEREPQGQNILGRAHPLFWVGMLGLLCVFLAAVLYRLHLERDWP